MTTGKVGKKNEAIHQFRYINYPPNRQVQHTNNNNNNINNNNNQYSDVWKDRHSHGQFYKSHRRGLNHCKNDHAVAIVLTKKSQR